MKSTGIRHTVLPVVLLVTMVFSLLVFSDVALAQRVRSEARLMLERLPLEKQELLKNFNETIEVYINDYDWTEEFSDEEIPVTIQIFLTDNSVSYEARYSGTFLITNNSDLQYYDRYWRFPYEAGDPVLHNENVFDPFTGFIDFYVYLILGGEFDKYGRFLGTPFYERAKQISDQAMFNVQFQLGWKERSELIEEILGEDNMPFRTLKDLFFLGLSYIGEEDATGKKYCLEALSMLEDLLKEHPDHEEAGQFIEAHHLEFIELFEGDQEVLKRLMRVDPEREETYRQYLDR